MNSQQFDNIIKSKSQQRVADVPDDIWENIIKEKRKRRMPFFWLILPGLLLGGLILLWNSYHSSSNKTIITTQKNEKENVKEPDMNSAPEITSRGNFKTVQENTESSTALTDAVKKDQPTNVVLGSRAHYNIQLAKTGENTGVDIVKTAGKYNVGITTPGLNENNETGLTETYNTNMNEDGNSFATKNKKCSGKGNSSILFGGGETNSILDSNSNKLAIGESQPETTSTLEELPVDTNVVASHPVIVKDSLAGNRKEIFITKKAVSGRKQSVKSLKVEVAVGVVSPLQDYTKPLLIKRVLDNGTVKSEFISDQIKTEVEPGTEFGINIVKSVSKQWSVGGGINYSRFTELFRLTGIETRTDITIIQRVVIEPNGPSLKSDTIINSTKSNTTINGRNIYTNIAVPLFVRHQFIERRKFAFAVTTGLYVEVLKKYHSDAPGKFENTVAPGNTKPSNNTHIGVDVFAALHFSGALWKKYDWFAAPGFRYGVSRYNANSLSFNKKIHKPVFSVGIAYRLKK